MNHSPAPALVAGTTVIDGLGALTRCVGREGFADAFCTFLSEAFGVRDLVALRRGPDQDAPAVCLSWCGDPRPAQDGAAGPDPLLAELVDDSPAGSYVLRVGAASRGGKLILARKTESDLVVLCAEADTTEAAPPQPLDELGQWGGVLLALLDLHCRLSDRREAPPQADAAQMEARVALSFPELTAREIAVCARTILGVTAEGIALDLGIKQTSVLTYRRRAYARLNINSINQLSTMLIQSSARPRAA